MKRWAPNNGASLEYVASRRGWPVVTAGPVTVAVANNGGIYYEGDEDLTLVGQIVRRLV